MYSTSKTTTLILAALLLFAPVTTSAEHRDREFPRTREQVFEIFRLPFFAQETTGNTVSTSTPTSTSSTSTSTSQTPATTSSEVSTTTPAPPATPATPQEPPAQQPEEVAPQPQTEASGAASASVAQLGSAPGSPGLYAQTGNSNLQTAGFMLLGGLVTGVCGLLLVERRALRRITGLLTSTERRAVEA